jgi:hypothetical protein
MVDWDIAVGEELLRRELHDRWGGGRYGGMEPSVKAESVFLLSKPAVGEAFGYNYDGWHADGTFHYTGDGQEGDQSLSKGGNKALMDAASLGRTVRLFRSEREHHVPGSLHTCRSAVLPHRRAGQERRTALGARLPTAAPRRRGTRGG